jgi:hypothetical protein
MSRGKRNSGELRTASDKSICYELDMLNETADILQKGQADKVLHDALLESFLLHARNLYEFFNPTQFIKGKEDSVIADDFLDVPNSLGKADISSFDKDKANNLLTHISYSRAAEYLDDEGWPYLKIQEEINTAMKIFVEKVDNSKIGDKLRSYKFTLKSNIPIPDAVASTGDAVSPVIFKVKPLNQLKNDCSTKQTEPKR